MVFINYLYLNKDEKKLKNIARENNGQRNINKYIVQNYIQFYQTYNNVDNFLNFLVIDLERRQYFRYL